MINSTYLSDRWKLVRHPERIKGVAIKNSSIKSISLIASANLIATVLGVLGSLVQARYIGPDDLGFVRKYAVISSYAIFLSFGLFTIIQREYPYLLGRGEEERAREAVAIGQTWTMLMSGIVCAVLLILALTAAIRSDWRTAAAWFIQVVSVWSILYGGFLNCTFCSGQQFERLSKGTFMSTVATTVVLPLFALWPFGTFVLRSSIGSIVSSIYLHLVRPVKVGFSLPRKAFFQLAKRGMRLFAGTYLRYHFWLTVEIWLMLKYSGDSGVGLMTFGAMIIAAATQLTTAVNQVYTPRLARLYGETGRIKDCLLLTLKPTVINLILAIICIGAIRLILPAIISIAFPKYLPAVPILNVLSLDTIVVALSLPVYMIPVLEDYGTQLIAAIFGLIVFVGLAIMLHHAGVGALSVIWGTIAGRFVFILTSLISLGLRCAKFHPILSAKAAGGR